MEIFSAHPNAMNVSVNGRMKRECVQAVPLIWGAFCVDGPCKQTLILQGHTERHDLNSLKLLTKPGTTDYGLDSSKTNPHKLDQFGHKNHKNHDCV